MSDQEDRDERLTPEKVRNKNLFAKPETQLDIQASLIEPKWGKIKLAKELEDKWRQYLETAQGGSKVQYLWELLSYYQSDLRLGYLNEVRLNYCNHYLKFCSVLIYLNHVGAFFLALNKVISEIELSMSFKGNLRHDLQTIRQESQHVQIEQEPKKRNLFGLIQGGKE